VNNLPSSNKSTSNIDRELLSACIHCGLCLPACPTYLATGRELESPRGRIHLLTQLASGQQELSPRLAEHIDTCLGCFGCETACPSGVQYERILNQARPEIAQMHSPIQRFFLRFSFKHLLPKYDRLRVLGSVMNWWQNSNAANVLNSWTSSMPIKTLHQWLHRVQQWQEFIPRIPAYKPLPKKAWRSGPKKGNVQLFGGCVMDVFYNDVNHACIRLLNLQSQIVEVPDQTCCGALAFHAGESDIARDLAKRNIEYFAKNEGEIIVTSAGCGAMLKEYGELLKDEPQWKERAQEFSQRVFDITEFLAANEFVDRKVNIKALPNKITYHAACHLYHAQKIRTAPEKLLNELQVKAIAAGASFELIPLNESAHCCGSAGIYNILNTDISLAILERKMDFIADTGADTIVTTNPGCLLQLEAGARAKGLTANVLHLADLLDRAYTQDEADDAD
jgi:glycolate oxidase iron-sulfur subunit